MKCTPADAWKCLRCDVDVVSSRGKTQSKALDNKRFGVMMKIFPMVDRVRPALLLLFCSVSFVACDAALMSCLPLQQTRGTTN